MLIDDLGAPGLGCYGGTEIDTPRIDRLATQGIRFADAYANCPVCSPSRAALMTGKYPARLGFTGHITATGQHRHPEHSSIIPPKDRMELPLAETTLAEALQGAGYRSASIGKWHLGPEGFWPEDQGFDVNVAGWTHGSPPSHFYPYTGASEWNPAIPTLSGGAPGEYLADRLTTEAIGFMEARRDQPFFLYLTHYAVHTPLQAPEDLVAKYTQRFADRDVAIDPVYAAMVENMDENTGRVLDALDRLGIADNTLVLFTSDNGSLLSSSTSAPLRAGKGYIYEGGIRVPLLLRWPGQVSPGAVSHEPVMGCDLYPTITAAAGVTLPDPESRDGLDLRPLWEGQTELPREALYWYYPHYAPAALMPAAAGRARDFKYIECYDPPRIELYNLREDPGETVNLVGALPEMAARYQRDIDSYLNRVAAIRHRPNPDYAPAPP